MGIVLASGKDAIVPAHVLRRYFGAIIESGASNIDLMWYPELTHGQFLVSQQAVMDELMTVFKKNVGRVDKYSRFARMVDRVKAAVTNVVERAESDKTESNKTNSPRSLCSTQDGETP